MSITDKDKGNNKTTLDKIKDFLTARATSINIPTTTANHDAQNVYKMLDFLGLNSKESLLNSRQRQYALSVLSDISMTINPATLKNLLPMLDNLSPELAHKLFELIKDEEEDKVRFAEAYLEEVQAVHARELESASKADMDALAKAIAKAAEDILQRWWSLRHYMTRSRVIPCTQIYVLTLKT